MNRQVIKKRIRKILAYTITSIVFLLISAFLTLQIPAVQDYLIDRYLSGFSKVIGFDSSIQTFRLLWFDRLELEGVKIIDPASNEMITAERIMVNFKLSQLLTKQNDINIDGVSVENAHVYVTKINESDTARNLNINVFVDRINENYGGSGGTGRTPRINIGEAVVNGSRFTYIDQDRDSIKTGFNYNQFAFDIDEAQLQNFLVLGDTTEFNITTLLATDQHKDLNIKELSTFFRLSQASMEFTGLNLKANDSFISDTILFTFNGQAELSDFIDKVNVTAHLENTLLQPKDLALFAPEVRNMTNPLLINGYFKGRINNFRFTDMEVATGNTILRGSLDMDGLPDIHETFIILDLKNSRLDFNDLAFVINDNIVQRLTPIGRVGLDGQFLGYPLDFVAKGNIDSRLGNISSDINFKVNEQDFDRSVYSGQLALDNFDLGTYLKDTVNFQQVSLSGKVKGKGLTKNKADFTLNGRVKSIGIRDYNYTNIETNARFASQLFSGLFKIDDPNLQFSAKGSIDLREGQNLIKVEAQLDTAYLHNLNLTSKSIFLHSNLNINTQGLHLDSLRGTADLKDFVIHYDGEKLALPKVNVNIERDKNQRAVFVESTLVDGEIKGDYLITDISKDIEKLVKEVLLNVRNDKEAIARYYATENYRPKKYEANFKVNLKDIDPLSDLLQINLLLSRNTKVEGKFTSGYTTILQAFAEIDSVGLNNTLLLHTEAEITASKIADSTSVLAMAFVNSDRQVITDRLSTKNLVVEGIWNKNHIDFGVDAEQENQTNYVRLKGSVDFLKDSTQIRMLPSTINLLDKAWQIDDQNVVTIQNRDVTIQDLKFEHQNEFVLFDGMLSTNPEKKMSLQVSNLDLSIFNPITGRKLKGTLGAMFDLTNFYYDPYVQNELRIDSLSIDDFLVGNIEGKNKWDTLDNKFVIDFFIDRNQKRIVNVTGEYDPARSSSPLDVNAHLDKANLKIVEPFFDYMFSHINGSITGDYRISGKLASPAITGEGQVANGQITINYTKVQYNFTGIVGLSPNSIYFKNIELTDNLGSAGSLNGTISHRDFRDTRINIDASFKSLLVLNTTEKDNSLFYGQGYATGDLNIFGPVNNLRFTANARTDKNTRISIPFDQTAEITQSSYLKFVSFKDSTFQKSLVDKKTSKLDLTGITIDFNLDVTPDAYCEIILDRKAGDIIRGRGKGDIQLQLDTKGEFNMFGPFEFTEGKYNFTLYDLMNKDFEIKPGSRITWYGDPYKGVLALNASYNQQASFGPIITDQEIADSPQLRRKYPVQVLLKVEGLMLSPDVIKFDIVTRDLPQSIVVNNRTVRLDFEFQAFKNRIDEQELNRQVFSLIILRRFSPPESFNTSGSIVNSVSELLSNQLSNFVSQVDENLEIDVDLSTFDDEAYNTFQLRLSYTFMNGRLRITRDGTFYGSQNNAAIPNNTGNQVSAIAGDWTVDYLLTADGKLKIKMYNRTNVNPILNQIGTGTSVTAGVSLSHTQSFNAIKDIWQSTRRRRQQQQQNQEFENDEAVKEEDDGGDD
ncbi:MAG TPA: translocation/assembly module TamB domain-containing protein [Chryseosolibacter sp.]